MHCQKATFSLFTFSGACPGTANTTSPAKLDKQQNVVLGAQSPSTGSVDPGGRQFMKKCARLALSIWLALKPNLPEYGSGYMASLFSSWANSQGLKATYNVRFVGAGFKAWISSSSLNDPVAARFICNQSKAMRKQLVVACSKEALSFVEASWRSETAEGKNPRILGLQWTLSQIFQSQTIHVRYIYLHWPSN